MSVTSLKEHIQWWHSVSFFFFFWGGGGGVCLVRSLHLSTYHLYYWSKEHFCSVMSITISISHFTSLR